MKPLRWCFELMWEIIMKTMSVSEAKMNFSQML